LILRYCHFSFFIFHSYTVTALYEIALVGSGGLSLESRRYFDNKTAPSKNVHSEELAILRLRYKAPDSDTNQLLEWS
jgi:Ca-activated chloride channel family protein